MSVCIYLKKLHQSWSLEWMIRIQIWCTEKSVKYSTFSSRRWCLSVLELTQFGSAVPFFLFHRIKHLMLFLVDHPISFYFKSKPSSISKEERKVKKKRLVLMHLRMKNWGTLLMHMAWLMPSEVNFLNTLALILLFLQSSPSFVVIAFPDMF